MADATQHQSERFRLSQLIYDTRYRSLTIQAVAMILLILAMSWLVSNTITNLAALGKDFNFGFLGQRAGYDINQRLIPYDSSSTHGRAALVGILNTLLIAALGLRARHHPRRARRGPAAVEELGGGAPDDGLRRRLPQRAAASVDPRHLRGDERKHAPAARVPARAAARRCSRSTASPSRTGASTSRRSSSRTPSADRPRPPRLRPPRRPRRGGRCRPCGGRRGVELRQPPHRHGRRGRGRSGEHRRGERGRRR